MTDTASLIGFSVILMIYASVGVFAVVGSAVITQRLFSRTGEQRFYALFLIAIAGFYLAFAAYFGADDAWRLESTAVAVFTAFGLLGLRWRSLLILGYVLHGLWDLLHELQAHGGPASFAPGQSTAVPLAYGVFCATFDLGMAAYLHLRRRESLPALLVARA